MNTHKKAYRLAYSYKYPNHRLTNDNLDQLKKESHSITTYPPIHLTVLHMATNEQHAVPDHDVYVNTKEMTYHVVLHGKSMCLSETENKPRSYNDYEPCECHEALCRKCHAPFMAMNSWCAEQPTCSDPECEYCTHYREECATEELTTEIIKRTGLWYKNPGRNAPKTGYHQLLKGRTTDAELTLAEAFSIAVAEVLGEDWPSLHPFVIDLLDKMATRQNRPIVTKDCWMFKDGSYIEDRNGGIAVVK